MKKMFLILTLAICFDVLFSACSDGSQASTRETTLFVGPQQVDCPSGPQGKCLQAKYSADDTDWINFGDVIYGFEWEAGYEYELHIKVTESQPRNSDFIFLSFELIEAVSKTRVE